MDPSMLASLPPNIDRRHSYVTLIWALFAFSTTFVLARLYMRFYVRKVAGWDDYLIVFAFIVQLVNNVFAQLAVKNGMLLHIYYLTPSQVANTVKWVKGIELCCITIPVLIKLSICVTILRLVTVAKRNITIAIGALMTVLTLTGIAAFLVEAMQCLPLRKLWEPEISGKCLSMETVNWVLVAYGIVCVVTDFICGIMPLIILRKLQMDRTTKTALCLLLGLVLVPGICSIFRTIDTLSLNNPDVTWAVSGVATWVCLEIETGFMIACLPMLWSPTVTAAKATSSYVSRWRGDYRSWRAWRSGQHRLGSGQSPSLGQSREKPGSIKHDGQNLPLQQKSDASSEPRSPPRDDSDEDLAELAGGAQGDRDLEVGAPGGYPGLGMSWN